MEEAMRRLKWRAMRVPCECCALGRLGIFVGRGGEMYSQQTTYYVPLAGLHQSCEVISPIL